MRRRHRPLPRAIDPRRGYDLLAIPRAVVEVEIAELRHVVGSQIKAAFSVRDVLRIGFAPANARNTQGFEQLVSRKIQRVSSGLLGDQRRQNVRIATVVLEARAGRVRHRLAENKLGDIRSLVHSHDGFVGSIGVF
jgi:hypothetical protein